jgi:hypothetical protein
MTHPRPLSTLVPLLVAGGCDHPDGEVEPRDLALEDHDDGDEGRHRGRHGRGHHGKRDMGAMFEKLDPDGDGKVALADLPERKREHLSQADADSDGFVTREELKAFHEAKLSALDKDGDGELSESEREAAREERRGHHAARRFAHVDDNRDGALTQDEVPPKHWPELKKADKNADDRLTLQEIEAAAAAGEIELPGGHGRGKGFRRH